MLQSKLARWLSCSAVACALATPAVPSFAKDKANEGSKDGENAGSINAAGEWVPNLRAASDAAELAIAKFKVAPGLKVKLWAAEPMLANPNALCTDERGRVYVAETYRYHGGVIDVRSCLNWLDEENGSKSVADRVAMVKRHASEKSGKEAIESRDSDRIVLLEDTTGSGRADKSTVFTTGYNRIEDGLGSGVLAYHGGVYYTCIPSLYLLKDTKGTGKADSKQALQTGYGIRYAYLGHDLHGLVIGPDGRLYFSIGDRGANVEQTPDGRTVQNLESGSVFRCDLDGTNLEIFATGLRNPQELRFDQFGNLFTGDNNPDKGDPARWVYVVEGGDSGWRVGYQHATHMANGGPWMAEQIWSPEANNNAAYIVPCVQALGAGPSGLAYYPGTGLDDKYQNHFFLCDFRGGSGNSGIWTFSNKVRGASFEIIGDGGKPVGERDLEHNNFINHILCVDCEFAVDGGLYIADWIDGWARPMAGRIYKVVDEAKQGDPLVLETKKLIETGMDGRPVEELTKLIAHPDIRVRQEAQFALAAKGNAAVPVLTKIALKADGGGGVQPRLHAIWGLGQIARKAPAAVDEIVRLLADEDVDVRCQTAKVIGDAKDGTAYDALLTMLKRPDARTRFFAAQALGKLGNKAAVPALFAALKENADQDATLRYACVNALAQLADAATLSAAGKDESRAVRLGAAVALRKLESPAIAAFLKDADAQVVLEAARAIHDLPIEAALPQLAAMIDQPLPKDADKGEKPPTGTGPKTTGTPGEWITWRVVNANFRLGTPAAAKALAAFGAREGAPAKVRVEALNDLAEWAKPEGRDHVTNLWRPLLPRDAKAAKDAVAGALEHVAKNAPDEVKVAATNVMRKFGMGDPAELAATVADAKAAPEVRVAALTSLAESKDARLAEVVKAALADKSEAVRREAIAVQATLPGGVNVLEGMLDKGTPRDKQAILTAFGNAAERGDATADAALGQWVDRFLAGQVQPELQLDLLEAAAKAKDAAIATKLRAYHDKLNPADKLATFRECVAGGDAAAGQKIFRERADVSCIRCHTAKGEGGVVGPPLDGIGAKQNRDYLLESIVDPNAKIAPGFESLLVQTTDGKYKTGVFKKEDDKVLVLLNPDLEPDKQLITIPKDQIKSRERAPSAMPEGLVRALSKQDLRDLIEFLATLK